MSNVDIIIHRGTHQIGGVATEIRTENARIIIDMGDELCLKPEDVSRPLDIDGVTNDNGKCDAVFFTHYHSDHIGQFHRVREGIPMYMGSLAKEIFLLSHHFESEEHKARATKIKTFKARKGVKVKDITVIPFLVDHSASDAYMFLIKAGEKKILHTGDFRLHGFRSKGFLPTIQKYVGKVDAIITEGTNLGHTEVYNKDEFEIQRKLKDYMEEYRYVFLLCSSTNLERICSAMHAVPPNKFFAFDNYQDHLLDLISKTWGEKTELYKMTKNVWVLPSIMTRLFNHGALICVRDNLLFRKIMSCFPKEKSIVLYSMWDGYLEEPTSTLHSFLKGWHWEKLHTSGHADFNAICKVIDTTFPDVIIPIHTEHGDKLIDCYGDRVYVLKDGEVLKLKEIL